MYAVTCTLIPRFGLNNVQSLALKTWEFVLTILCEVTCVENLQHTSITNYYSIHWYFRGIPVL